MDFNEVRKVGPYKTLEDFQKTLVTFNEYSNNGKCPVCRSTDIEFIDTDSEDNMKYDSMCCIDCESKWTEFYTMTSYELDTVPDRVITKFDRQKKLETI